MRIHPTAVIEDGAEISEGASIGAYSVVGPNVKLGVGVQVLAHVTIAGATEIGARTVVHPHASLGGPPQHLAYRGEGTRLLIGADNVIREYVTMNIGTAAGRGETRVGARGYFMIGAHVAHDCQLGNHVILVNNATLGGHVEIGDFVIIGGLSAVHQFVRIGEHAMIGGASGVETDVIPFGSATGNRAVLGGLNLTGMKRRNFARDDIHALRSAYKYLFSAEGTFADRCKTLPEEYSGFPSVKTVLKFISEETKRGFCQPE